MKKLMVRLAAWMIVSMPLAALAQDAVAVPEAPSWLAGLVAGVPVKIIIWTLLIFGVLKALSELFNKIAEATEAKWDNKAALYFGKFIGFMSKIIDFFTANSRSKPPAA